MRVEKGKVRFFDPHKSFGYIIPDVPMPDGLDVFAHRNQFVEFDGDFGDQPFPISNPNSRVLSKRMPQGVEVVFAFDDNSRVRLWGLQTDYDAAIRLLDRNRRVYRIVRVGDGAVLWEGKNIIRLQREFPVEFHPATGFRSDENLRLEWLMADGGWYRVQPKDDPRSALIRKTGANPWIAQGASRAEDGRAVGRENP